MQILALGCMVTSAFAGTVTMTLTSPGNNVMGGVYVSPYTALVDGVPTTVICDSFNLESYVPETWTANEYDFTQLSQTYNSIYNGATQANYNEMAWLALKLLSETNATVRGQISFALWAVLTPSALTKLSGTNLTEANSWLTQAAAHASDQFTNVYVLSPVMPTDATCPAYPNQVCPYTPPQEFLVVKTPEPAAATTLAFDLAALVVLVGFAVRRRTIQLAR